MSERRRTGSTRYSPYQAPGNFSAGRASRRERAPLTVEHEENVVEEQKGQIDENIVIDDYDQVRGELVWAGRATVHFPVLPDAIVEEEAVPLKDIGQHARDQEFTSNAEIIVSGV